MEGVTGEVAKAAEEAVGMAEEGLEKEEAMAETGEVKAEME